VKLRFPLSVKILLWFFLNLALLGAVLYGFIRIQFRFGLDSLLAGHAGERMESIGLVLGRELRDAQRENWTDILHRYNAAYNLQFSLHNADGDQLAGETVSLPVEVARRLKEFGPPQRPVPPGPERIRDRPPRENAPPPPPRRQHPMFMVRTTNPVAYWVGMRLPIGERQRPEGPPLFLLAKSPTLSGGGLFFDYKPWVMVGFGAGVLSMLFWLPVIRGITRSVTQMTLATEQIAAGRFDVRVNEARRDELGRLGGAINRMTVRLNGFVTGQKRFLGDVAHELCSPLARIQVALGILEHRADEKQRTAVQDVREEVQQMSQLVNELLSFSKTGLREKQIALQPVQLADLARQVVARESDGGVPIEIDEDLTVLAEPGLLARALANLVRNALRYAGNARIQAVADGESVCLTVSDTGPGVPADQLEQIFDPFYRLEPSRNNETGGVGLGLTIVKSCIEACGGTVRARNRHPNGLEIEIRLYGRLAR
jgi:two-component system sensor histidine kinase CpxA